MTVVNWSIICNLL